MTGSKKKTRNKKNSLLALANNILYADLVKNRICKRQNVYYCYLCTIPTRLDCLSDVAKHIKDISHIHRYKTNICNYFDIDEEKCKEIVLNSIIPIDNSSFYCTVCVESISDVEQISKHINDFHSEKESPSQAIQNNSNAANNVALLDIPVQVILFCNDCKKYLKTDASIKYHRMFHINRKINFNKFIDVINFSNQNHGELCINCTVCHCQMKSEEDLEDHTRDINHLNRLKFLNKPEFISELDDSAVLLNNYEVVEDKMKSLEKTTIEFHCQICKTKVPNGRKSLEQHKSGRSHLSKMRSISKDQLIKIADNRYRPIYTCFTCNIEFSKMYKLVSHYSEPSHMNRIKIINLIVHDESLNFVIDGNEITIHCSTCNVKMIELQSTVNHLSESIHKAISKNDAILDLIERTNNVEVNIVKIENFKEESKAEKKTLIDHQEINLKTTQSFNYNRSNSSLSNDKINYVKNINQAVQTKSVNNHSFPYSCSICNINGNEITITSHLKSRKHEKKTFDFIKNHSDNSLKEVKYSCFICNERFFSDVQFLFHLNGPSHKNEIQSHPNETKSNDSADSFQSCNSHFCLDNYSDIKLLDSDKFLSISKPTLAELFTNLSDFGQTYISMCIKRSGANIFKIDSEILQKLQVGLSSTFVNREMRVCIPCGEEISNDLFLIYDHFFSKKHIESLKEMEIYDKDFKQFPDQFSNLQLSKLYMAEVSVDLVKCFACDIDCQNNDIILRNHARSNEHLKTSQIQKKSEQEVYKKIKSYLDEIWYYAERFFCEICTLKFDSDILFAEHLASKGHSEKNCLATSGGDRLKFHSCIICTTYWYGKSDYSTHSDGHFHQYFFQNKSFISYTLADSVKNIFNLYESITESLIEQSNSIDKSVEMDLLKSIKEIVRNVYPSVEAHLFGSRECSLAFPDSDSDIYIDCENNYEKVLSIDEMNGYLLKIQEQLLKYEDTWMIEEVLLKAKIPIMKLRHRNSNLHCSISCSNGLNVEKTTLLRLFVKSYPNCQKLILFLKKWLILNRLSSTDGITSFAVSNFVIFYLQTEDILPSVYEVIKLRASSIYVAGWEITRARSVSFKKTEKSLKELLVGFFQYYARFNYMTNVICPYLGKLINKGVFANFNDLPLEMENYKKLYNEKIAEYFRFDSPMCLQDPVDLSHNVTKAVTKFQLRSFKQYCQDSAEILLKQE